MVIKKHAKFRGIPILNIGKDERTNFCYRETDVQMNSRKICLPQKGVCAKVTNN
jgi:hypothetical protein